MNPVVTRLDETSRVYRQLITRFDDGHGVMWYYMDARPRPCLTPGLLDELTHCQRLVEQVNRTALDQGGECPIPYVVLASRTQGVYSFGGDLDLFRRLIAARDREGLWRYAKSCIDLIDMGTNNLRLPMTTISLVQGDALGGGFESALCCPVVVAEKRARFGFPEILFNLIPGMGAYSLLARRIGSARAERMIASGKVYTASELHEMGVVDILAEDGEGQKAVYEFIDSHVRRRNAFRALFRVRQRVVPISYDELRDVAAIWVDTALNIPARDLKLMERLARAQDRLSREAAATDTATPAGSV